MRASKQVHPRPRGHSFQARPCHEADSELPWPWPSELAPSEDRKLASLNGQVCLSPGTSGQRKMRLLGTSHIHHVYFVSLTKQDCFKLTLSFLICLPTYPPGTSDSSNCFKNNHHTNISIIIPISHMEKLRPTQRK